MNPHAAEAQIRILNGPDTPGRRWLMDRLRAEAERNTERLRRKDVPPDPKPLPTPKLTVKGQPLMFDVNDPELQGDDLPDRGHREPGEDG
jgi:hypothetical protein